MPLSVLQFILLTANWANGLRRGAIVKKKKERKQERDRKREKTAQGETPTAAKITYGRLHSKMHPVHLQGFRLAPYINLIHRFGRVLVLMSERCSPGDEAKGLVLPTLHR